MKQKKTHLINKSIPSNPKRSMSVMTMTLRQATWISKANTHWSSSWAAATSVPSALGEQVQVSKLASALLGPVFK